MPAPPAFSGAEHGGSGSRPQRGRRLRHIVLQTWPATAAGRSFRNYQPGRVKLRPLLPNMELVPMALPSPHRTITDDLLAVAIRIKRDAGVAHPQIQGVIDKFACQAQWHERTGGIGF